MDRRRILYGLLGLVPAAEIAWSQSTETVKVPASAAEAVAQGLPRFFSAALFAAFAELAETLVPAWDGRPGAKEAEAAEFLDFLLAQSPADAQSLYRQGIVTYQNRRKTNAATALQELNEPWTYQEPKDTYRRFLLAAKQAVWQATLNSRAYAEAMSARSRNASGVGSYWLPVE